MQSTLSYAVLVLCVGFVAAEVYTDCGSKLATVENVKVSGCDGTQEECILKRNTNVTISMDIIPNVPLTKVNTVVHGVMMGMPVPFPLSNPNACEGTGLTCPLNQKEKYSYSAIMPVLKAYPKVNVDVKWELQNEDNIDIACLLIPAKIQ